MSSSASKRKNKREFNPLFIYLVMPLLLGALAFFSVTNAKNISRERSRSFDAGSSVSDGDQGGISPLSRSDAAHSDTGVNESATRPKARPNTKPAFEAGGDLSESLNRIARSFKATAVQTAIIKDGRVSEFYNYGKADKSRGAAVTPETNFRVASLSKLIVTMAVMKLSEEGKIDIDGDIGDYLGYTVRSKRSPETAITPRMLMSHTSTLVDSKPFLKSRNRSSSVSLEELLSMASSYSGCKTGTAYRYSNFGVAVLAAAAEKQAGVPFYEYTEEKLFRPLGIKGSFLASRIQDTDSIACLYNTEGSLSYGLNRQLNEKCHEKLGQTHHIYQGNLTISASDYAKLLCVLLNGGRDENGVRILSSGSVKEILTIQYDAEGVRSCLGNMVSGSIVKGRTMHYHTGSNFGMYSSFAFDPSDRSGVVVLTSGAGAAKEYSGVYNICGQIIRKIYEKE